MSTDINSTTFLVKGTLIALLTFFGTLFVGNDAMAFGCDEACEEALGEGGSLRAAADAACDDWEYWFCTHKPNNKITCTIACYGDGEDAEFEIPGPS